MAERSSREKRERILMSALEVFVQHGYVGTSTDQLAAAAKVSKQTLYREFGDKEGVFESLIRFAGQRVEDPFAPLVSRMHECDSAEQAVGLIAQQFTRSIMDAQIQRLRRLVIAEAVRFPHLARMYWENGFLRTLLSIERCLTVLDSRKLLSIPDVPSAAQHFAGLLLWIPGNRSMFAVEDPVPDADELDELIAAGAGAFLRAYAPGEA